MARGTLRSRVSLGSAPRWLALVGIIVMSRLVSTAIMLWFAGNQAENPWTAAHPDLVEFSRIWDSHWYRVVAENGYPTELPIMDDGRVGESGWAFLPLYPMTVRLVMMMTGADFAHVSIVLSLIAFVAFVFVADRFFRPLLGGPAALAAIAVVVFAPVSPIFQVGYAESFGMLFLALALVGVAERRWGLAALAIPLAALSRPLGVPITLAVGILWLMSLRTGRDRRPFFLLALWSGLWALAWPAAAWIATGRLTAYLETELAWRRDYVRGHGHGWGTGWWDSAQWWFPDTWPWVLGALGLVVATLAVAPPVRRLGPVALTWTWSYFGYLVIVLFPQSSIFRLLAPAFPLAGAVARSRWGTALTIALGIVGQYFWVQWMWSVEGQDWTPP